MRLYVCTSVRLYFCTSPWFSIQHVRWLHWVRQLFSSKLGVSTLYIVLIGVISHWCDSNVQSKQFWGWRKSCCYKPPTGGWRGGGGLLTLEGRWSSWYGGQPHHWRLLQCGYHLHILCCQFAHNHQNRYFLNSDNQAVLCIHARFSRLRLSLSWEIFA